MTVPAHGSLAAITPSVQEVADLVRVRVVAEGGYMESLSSFDGDTYPTDADVERIITQAANFMFTQVPGSVVEPWDASGRHLVALYAAIIVETSYYREQLTDDMVALYREMLDAGIKGLGASTTPSEPVGSQASRMVDTVVMRGIATEPPWMAWLRELPDFSETNGAP
jgi:hypothetical protein